jgi:hypothetical protein
VEYTGWLFGISCGVNRPDCQWTSTLSLTYTVVRMRCIDMCFAHTRLYRHHTMEPRWWYELFPWVTRAGGGEGRGVLVCKRQRFRLATRKNVELHRNLRFSDTSDGPGNMNSESSGRFCSRVIRMSVYYFHVLREKLKEVHISITCNYGRSTPLICAPQDMK